MKKLILLLLLSTAGFAQPCEGNNGNNNGGVGNNGQGYGNDPCNPVPMSALPLFGLVVVGALGYTYYKYYKLKHE